jgi:hypothetical protein
MSDDNTQGAAEPSLASAGSVGSDLYGGGFNKWLASIGKTRETATDADDIQWLKLDRHRLNMLWRWIPVTERLPDVDDHVLIFCPLLEPEETTCADRQANGMWVCDDGQLLGATEPTHWMPFPALPSDG